MPPIAKSHDHYTYSSHSGAPQAFIKASYKKQYKLIGVYLHGNLAYHEYELRSRKTRKIALPDDFLYYFTIETRANNYERYWHVSTNRKRPDILLDEMLYWAQNRIYY
jgi:endo-alpha-1,4-polygalactosaminidase (GH114 family)